MHDQPQQGQNETSVLPEDELDPRGTEMMLIEDQPVTFLKPEAIPEDSFL